MDTNKIQQAYADKRAAEQQSQQSVKDTEKYTKKLIGSDRIQKAIIESARLSIEHRDGHEPKVEVKNFPKSVKTPDVKEVVNAINQMSKDVAPKNIDFSPLQESIANLSEQIANLPTEYPEAPEPVEEVMVNNLSELKTQLEDITKAVEKLKLDPKIKVDVKSDPIDLQPILDALNKEEPEEIEIEDFMVEDQIYEGTMQYFGFGHPKGYWMIMENDITSGKYRYACGADDYTRNWKNRSNLKYGSVAGLNAIQG